MTDQSIDRKVGTWSNNFNYRAPPSIASKDETVLVGWDQTSRDGPSQDLMTATVQLTERPADNPAIPYVLAALLGLAAGGLALLAMTSAVGTRRNASGRDVTLGGALSWRPDGRALATGSRDGVLTVLDCSRLAPASH